MVQSKAKRAASTLRKGKQSKKFKLHTKIRFFRKPTKVISSNPKIVRNAKKAFKL